MPSAGCCREAGEPELPGALVSALQSPLDAPDNGFRCRAVCMVNALFVLPA